MRIAYLTNIPINFLGWGGSVHVSQVGDRLSKRGHQLFTNLQNESKPFVKLTERGFLKRGEEIGVFYIRIDGWAERDELTLLRQSNTYAPCIWEVNAPLEELRTLGRSGETIQNLNIRRKKLARMVDAAICVSDEMEEYARGELGIKETFVVPNGSDVELFSPERRDEGVYDRTKFRVLWSGSPKYEWQGFRIVQELAEALKGKGMNDVLIIVTTEGVSSDNILHLGHIPYTDMPRYIASADVGLCIYKNIDFYRNFYFSPLKLYDYMASGIPVIGTETGQIKLVIEEQRNGLLTDNTIDDLIEKITFLKTNSDVARQMGLRGRQAALDKYNWNNVVLQTESIFLETAERRRASFNKQPQRMLAGMAFNYRKIVMSVQLYRKLLRRVVYKAKNIVTRAWTEDQPSGENQKRIH